MGKKKCDYEVQIRLANGEWENCVSVDDEPFVFDTKEAADRDLAQTLSDLKAAEMDFNPEDYRVQPVPEKVYPHITVIGRRDGDDNTCRHYEGLTVGAAEMQFKKDMDAREVYIDSLLTASSPMRNHGAL